MLNFMVSGSQHCVLIFISSAVWLHLCLASPVQAGPLEEKTQRLLNKLASATEEDEKAEILRDLGAIGPEARAAIPTLAGMLGDEELGFRAAQFLASMGAESIDALRAGLRHKDTSVRVRTLATIGSSEMYYEAEPLIPDIMKLHANPRSKDILCRIPR